jgi:hypothetical protein
MCLKTRIFFCQRRFWSIFQFRWVLRPVAYRMCQKDKAVAAMFPHSTRVESSTRFIALAQCVVCVIYVNEWIVWQDNFAVLQNGDHTICHQNYNRVYFGTSVNPEFNDFEHHSQFIGICYWYISPIGCMALILVHQVSTFILHATHWGSSWQWDVHIFSNTLSHTNVTYFLPYFITKWYFTIQ